MMAFHKDNLVAPFDEQAGVLQKDQNSEKYNHPVYREKMYQLIPKKNLLRLKMFQECDDLIE